MKLLYAICLSVGILGFFFLAIFPLMPIFAIASIPLFAIVLLSMVSKSLLIFAECNDSEVCKVQKMIQTMFLFVLVCYVILLDVTIVLTQSMDNVFQDILFSSLFVFAFGFFLEKYLTKATTKIALKSLHNKKLPFMILLAFFGCAVLVFYIVAKPYFVNIITHY